LKRSAKSHRTAAAQLSGARPTLRGGPAADLVPRRAGAADWRRRLERGKGPPPAAPDPFTRDASTARLEAVLFLSREPINTRRLAQLANLADGTEARTLVRRLNEWYDASGCAFRAEEVAGGFQLMSRPQFAGWLRKGIGTASSGAAAEVRLSAPALETLAVVAYRQPVMRSEIEAIRGVDCGEILRQLMERGLVRTAGRAHELGRPYLYSTTRRFLQVFGLKHLDDLPRAEQLRAALPSDATPQNSVH
jgi:segregation and condensation protein B